MASRWNLARDICDTGRQLHERGFIAAIEGNISVRQFGNEILCTPSQAEKGRLEPLDLCVVDLDGRQVSGKHPPTSEILLHLELYRQAPETQAVVHCHPPHATALAVSSMALPTGLLAEAEFFLGEVPVLPYAPPGSHELAALIAPHARSARCALLRNHGAISWACDLRQARWWMEMLEAYCRTIILARSLGAFAPMSQEQVAALRTAGHDQTPAP